MTPQECQQLQAELDYARQKIATAQADLQPALDALSFANGGVQLAMARVAAAQFRYQSDIDTISINTGMIRQIEMQMQMGGCQVH